MAERTIGQAYAEARRQHEAGRVEEARLVYGEVLAREPEHPGALRMLGRLAFAQGRAGEAAELLGRALARDPGSVELHANLGAALAADGRMDEAIAEFNRALTIMPNSAALHGNLGTALLRQGDLPGAIAAYQRAAALGPDDTQAHAHLASAFTAAGRLGEAVGAFEKLLSLRPNDADALAGLGDVLWQLGRPDQAADAYRRAIAVRPRFPEALARLGAALKDQGELDAAIEAWDKSLQLRPDPAVASMRLYALHLHPDYGPRKILGEHRAWHQTYARPLAERIAAHANDPSPERRLRVGYVGYGMNNSGIGRFLLPLLAHHDPAAFEVFCYCDVARPDVMTERLRSHANQWRAAAALTDDQLAARVREDGIDLLVDLNLHAARSRLLTFAQNPAPVQLTYLAYCGTSGLEAMDYRLSDPYLDPPGCDESVYTEKTVRLADCFWCYAAPPEAPPVGPVPALAAGAITLGCLNAFEKVSAQALALWCEVMRAVPGSRLLLHSPEGMHRQRITKTLTANGIDPMRVQFAGFLSMEQYFQQYQQIDIALDPFPYPGGTTTCDALWMGVPVITLPGATGLSRGGLSILSNIGMAELAAATPQEYVRIAADLAQDPPRLQSLRITLRARMQDSPLMDAPRFARHVEAAFRQMWRHWCAA